MTATCATTIIVDSPDIVIVNSPDIAIIQGGMQGPIGPPGTTNPTGFNIVSGAVIAIDWTPGDIGSLTLTSNATVSMTGTRKKVMLTVVQGGIGNFGIVWDAATVNFGQDIPAIILSTIPGKTDYIGFVKNPLNNKYDVVAFARGY